jgi:hypothetical protein
LDFDLGLEFGVPDSESCFVIEATKDNHAMQMRFRLLILLSVAILLAGCGQSHVGTYVMEVRVIEGKTETKKYPLAEIKEQVGKYEESIELKSAGRYFQKAGGRIHEGDWWVADGRLAIRCDTQNGRRMGKGLISDGADRHYTIRGKGELVRGPYDQADSNLEVVYVKR